MAKKFYTTVPRMVGNTYVNGSPEDPQPVTFPKGFDPLGRKVKRKVTETVTMKKKIKTPIEVKAPKSGEVIKTEIEVEVDYPVTTEVEKEEYVAFTPEEIAARGLIVRDEADPEPEGQKLKPHFAKDSTGAAAPAAHTRDQVQRPSDAE